MSRDTFLSPFISMIASNCPNWMVLDALRNHLTALKTLDESVKDRDVAIAETEALINELSKEEN